MTAATDRAPGSTEDPEHGADDEQDHPDGPKDADACDQADQQQDEASNDHETEEYRSRALLRWTQIGHYLSPPVTPRRLALLRWTQIGHDARGSPVGKYATRVYFTAVKSPIRRLAVRRVSRRRNATVAFRVLEVVETPDELVIEIETTPVVVGCGECGTRAVAHERIAAIDRAPTARVREYVGPRKMSRPK